MTDDTLSSNKSWPRPNAVHSPRSGPGWFMLIMDSCGNLHRSTLFSRRSEGPEIEALATALKSVSPEVTVREEESGVRATWEWLLPAAVMVYIGKGLLDGFLKEIGAGAAKSLKTALVNAFRKGKSSGGKWMNLEQMEGYLKEVEAQGRHAAVGPGRSEVPLWLVLIFHMALKPALSFL